MKEFECFSSLMDSFGVSCLSDLNSNLYKLLYIYIIHSELQDTHNKQFKCHISISTVKQHSNKYRLSVPLWHQTIVNDILNCKNRLYEASQECTTCREGLSKHTSMKYSPFHTTLALVICNCHQIQCLIW